MRGSKEMYLEMQQEAANRIIEVENGTINPLDALIDLKEMKKACEGVIDYVKAFESEYIDDITFEADKYPNGYMGYEIQIRNGRKTFDYSNVEEVKIAEANVKELKAHYKNAYEMKMKGTLMADRDGVELQLPEMSVGKSSIILKKKD